MRVEGRHRGFRLASVVAVYSRATLRHRPRRPVDMDSGWAGEGRDSRGLGEGAGDESGDEPPSTSEATRPLAKLSAPSMPELQLALVLVTFLLAIATFWMAYESRKHIRLTRAQYLADRTPLITPRVERCRRSRDVLSTTLVVQNTGTGAIIIHGADIHSQNHRHPGSSSIAPGRPYRIAVVTLHPRHEVRFDLTLPVSDDDLAGGEDIGIWTVHVHLSIRGFPESLETWTVFAFIRYVEGQFQVEPRTFGPALDDRTIYQRLQGWFKRLPLCRRVARPGRWKRQPTSLDIFGPGAGDVTPRG